MSQNQSIREIMHTDLQSVPPTTSIYDTVKVLKKKNIGALAVMDGEKIVGMFSERDLVTKVVCEGLDTHKVPIKDVMTSPVITVSEEASFQDAYVLMNDNHIRHLPIVDQNGQPIGLVGLRDLMQGIMQEMIEDFLNEAA